MEQLNQLINKKIIRQSVKRQIIFPNYSSTHFHNTMQKDTNPYIDHYSWMNFLGDFQQAPQIQPQIHLFNQHPASQIQQEVHLTNQHLSVEVPRELNNFLLKNQSNDINHQIQELICLHQTVDKQLFKRSHSDAMIQQDFFTSNSSSSELKNTNMALGNLKPGYKKQKYAKQYIYSKNYRDKKKIQFKLLQEQNIFLKNKIDELQSRLRQKQLQINRLKHHSQEKQLTIQQLNRQFLTKVSLFAQKVQTIIDKQQTITLPPQGKKVLLDQLIKTYDEHGFAGSRKKQILGYYMDEILQVVLRDSEKYLCMLCCKNKDPKLDKKLPEYQKINTAFFQIMQMTQQDQQRLQKYITYLFPIIKQIKKQCSELYKNYSRILASMDKVHQFMKISYTDNLDFVKKRMKMESWFEYHKYNRMMRRLKEQWLDLIKKQRNGDSKDHLKPKSLTKKSKLDCSDLQS